KYEDEMYRELLKGLPKVGTTVMTPQGPGRVIEVLTLKESVLVDLGEGRRVVVKAKDLEPNPDAGEPVSALTEAPPQEAGDDQLAGEAVPGEPGEEAGGPEAAAVALVHGEAAEEAEAVVQPEEAAAPQAPARPPRRRSRRSRAARARREKGGDGSAPATGETVRPVGAAHPSPAPEGDPGKGPSAGETSGEATPGTQTGGARRRRRRRRPPRQDGAGT